MVPWRMVVMQQIQEESRIFKACQALLDSGKCKGWEPEFLRRIRWSEWITKRQAMVLREIWKERMLPPKKKLRDGDGGGKDGWKPGFWQVAGPA